MSLLFVLSYVCIYYLFRSHADYAMLHACAEVHARAQVRRHQRTHLRALAKVRNIKHRKLGSKRLTLPSGSTYHTHEGH